MNFYVFKEKQESDEFVVEAYVLARILAKDCFEESDYQVGEVVVFYDRETERWNSFRKTACKPYIYVDDFFKNIRFGWYDEETALKVPGGYITFSVGTEGYDYRFYDEQCHLLNSGVYDDYSEMYYDVLEYVICEYQKCSGLTVRNAFEKRVQEVLRTHCTLRSVDYNELSDCIESNRRVAV